MKWLPSFVKLFLVFVLGGVLLLGGAIGEMYVLGNYVLSSIFATLSLVGLLLVPVSAVLMGVKFFAGLDQKAQ